MHAVTGEQRVVAGRYLLQHRIGRGAMGTVWRARDPVLARDVAIKEVQVPGLLTTQERAVLQERTLREARAAARLNHPGVVTVFDVVEADGNPWIVMELVQARSLEQVLAADGPLSPAQAAEVGSMLLGALACAHAAGIMHRDVKPSNVLLAAEGRAVLTDFGIATAEGDPGLTQVGMVMGTPGFCAPERIRGDPATPASDLWSVGATLYAAVEGHGPFSGRSTPMAALAAVANEEAPPARSAGPLGPLIAALLRRDPGQRPDTATAQRLLASASGQAGSARPTGAAAGLLAAPPAIGSQRAAAAGAGPGRWSPAPPSGLTVAEPARPGLARPGLARPGLARPGLAQPGPAQPGPAQPGPAQPGPAQPGPALARPARAGVSLAAAGAAASAPPGPAGQVARAGYGLLSAGPALLSGSQGSHARTPSAGPGRRRRTRPSGGLLAAGAALVVGAGLLIGFLAAHGARASAGSALNLPAAPAGGAAGVLPHGFRWLSVSSASAGSTAGFTMAVPDAWQAYRQGLTTDVQPPSGPMSLSVSLAPFAAATVRAEAGLLQHRTLAGAVLGYRPGSLRNFRLAGAPAASWTFSVREPGIGQVSVQEVVFSLRTPAGRQSYSLRMSAPAPDRAAGEAVLGQALRTFRAHR